MVPGLRVQFRSPLSRRGCVFGLLAGALAVLSACSGVSELFNATTPSSSQQPPPSAPTAPQAQSEIGTGGVRVALILPLSAGGNAGTVALSMKNAAEMALAEFNSPNVQLLVKDDGGNSGGAQQAAQQALSEGAEIIIGPLFAHSVSTVGAVARQRGVPVIAFSTDATVAARGVYLLSFLPESDVDRIVEYSIASGKRSFAAMLSEGAYGNVVEAEFKQVVARKGGRVVALERYSLDANKMQVPAKVVAQAARGADAVFIPEGPEVVPSVVQALTAAGLNTKRVQLLGTGLWDDPAVAKDASLIGGWYSVPPQDQRQNFSNRYQQLYTAKPPRIATLAYDGVALAATLSRGAVGRRYTTATITDPNGFSGIDGIFRFLPNGFTERGLAVMEIAPNGSLIVASPAASTFQSQGF